MPGNTPTPGYRAISKSSRFSQSNGTPPAFFIAAPGIVSIDNRPYVMSEVEYSAGLSNFYDASFPETTLLESYYGLYLLIFVAGPNFLSDVFSSCISDYTNCRFYPGPSAATNIPIANAAALQNANASINPKDIDIVTGYNSLKARMDEPQIWQNLMNVRMVASFHIPIFAGQNILAWNANPTNPYNKVSQKFVIPAGYKYLVTMPTLGLWTNQTLGASTYLYNASFRCSLELPT